MNGSLSTVECIYHRFLGIGWEYNQGIDPAVVTPIAGEILAKQLSESTDDRPLFINCEGMTLCIDHSMQRVREEIDKTERSLLFKVPMHDSNFENKLLAELGEPTLKIESDSYIVLVYGKEKSRFTEEYISQTIESVSNAENQYMKQNVASCYKSFVGGKQRLPSTPLLAKGIFNARYIISNKNAFMWGCMLLAEKTRARIMETYPDNIYILAISLRGSPIAAGVWSLLRQHDPYIEIIDHIGPVHELLEKACDHQKFPDKNYFLIGDFILGGTELKSAISYAITHQSKLNSAVFIGALLDGEQYSNNTNIDAIVKLNDCVSDLSYEI